MDKEYENGQKIQLCIPLSPAFTRDCGEGMEIMDEPRVVNRNNWKQAEAEKKRKLSFKEQREWETIEADIADLEQSIGDLEQEIGKYATNYTRLNELMEEKSAKEAQLEEKMKRWMYIVFIQFRIENPLELLIIKE